MMHALKFSPGRGLHLKTETLQENKFWKPYARESNTSIARRAEHLPEVRSMHCQYYHKLCQNN